MKTYTASEIADYFLAKSDGEDGDLISNLKLQKLCYYAQGIGLVARNGSPLFSERLEAWLHGPVVPALYGHFKKYGRDAIPPVSVLDLTKYDPADLMILDDVCDYYGQYSAWRLREMTHAEDPWKNAYDAKTSNVISLDALLSFFSGQVSSDYRNRYEQVSSAAKES